MPAGCKGTIVYIWISSDPVAYPPLFSSLHGLFPEYATLWVECEILSICPPSYVTQFEIPILFQKLTCPTVGTEVEIDMFAWVSLCRQMKNEYPSI